MSERKRVETKRSQGRVAKSLRKGRPAKGGGNRAAKRAMAQNMYAPSVRGVSGSSFTVARSRAMAGQEDVEIVKMRYETTSAFTLTGGSASYVLVKGNSIYRPYGSNTDNPAGYQRLYTQYFRSNVLASRVEVRLWSNTSAGVQQPFRIAAVPCTSSQSTVYTGYSNIASLRGVPHSTEALYSPGATLPVLRSAGTQAQILFGRAREDGYETVAGTSFCGESGADPTTVWYHVIGLQAMAGTTSLDAQLQVMIEFEVMFFRPIATAVQSLNRFGNEDTVSGSDGFASFTPSSSKGAPIVIGQDATLEKKSAEHVLSEQKDGKDASTAETKGARTVKLTQDELLDVRFDTPTAADWAEFKRIKADLAVRKTPQVGAGVQGTPDRRVLGSPLGPA